MTEQAKLLFELLNDLNGSPANMLTVARFERILRNLNECEDITLLVDIDGSVNSMKNYVERL